MEITTKDIEKLIELRKEDAFLNHLWNVFSRDFRQKGEVEGKEIKAWKQNRWNSIFYPIFRFELNSSNHLINIFNTLNLIGKTLVYLFFLGITYVILANCFNDFDLSENWLLVLILSIFLFIVIVVLRKIYSVEKQYQLEEIYEILEIEIESKKPKKEWY